MKNTLINNDSAYKGISNITSENPSFDTGIMRIAYHGLNNKNMFISKEAFENATKSMYNCPIVGNYLEDVDDLGGHDFKLKEENKKYDVVPITQPIGIIPESAKYWWEEIVDDNGTHEYLCVDVLLWKRQEAYRLIKENGVTEQSMEIKIVSKHKNNDGLIEIDKFYFTAFCLLGTGISPCYEGASLEVFSDERSDFEEQFSQMKNELEDMFFELEKTKGVQNMKLQDLLDLYGVTVEELDFDYEGMTDEELEEAFKKQFGEPPVKEDKAEDKETEEMAVEEEPAEVMPEETTEEEVKEPETETEPEAENKADDLVQLNSRIQQLLYYAVAGREKVARTYYDVVEDKDVDYETSKYMLVDIDAVHQFVYYMNYLDSPFDTVYKAPYVLVNDDVEVKFEAEVRQIATYRDYVGVEKAEEEEFSNEAGRFDAVNKIIENLSSSLHSLNDEKKSLEKSLAKYKKAEAEKICEQFEAKIGETAEYQKLKENMANFSIDELEEKLYAIVGKYTTTFSSTKPLITVGVSTKTTIEKHSRYGDLLK